MSDPSFLKSLQELNCDAITWKQVQQVKAHMKKSNKLDDMKKVNIVSIVYLSFRLSFLDLFYFRLAKLDLVY